MPSPQVIDLTHSDDDKIQPDPIRSDQRTLHTQATNRLVLQASPRPINRTQKSPSHSRYSRTSGKLSPTPTFLQQHSLWLTLIGLPQESQP